jgi:putative redox protein
MGVVIVRSRNRHGLRQDVDVGSFQLTADEPPGAGGDGTGPSPYDLLVAALGSCTAMTLQIYARRYQWPLERVVVRLRHARMHGKDCGDCETDETFLDRIEREIVLEGPLDHEQRARLMRVADRCPVHQTLTRRTRIETREVRGEESWRRAA